MKEKHLCDENMSFAYKYNIAIEEYSNTPISSLPFSTRSMNRFLGNGITTVADLLESSPSSLMDLKGFGRNCLDEVDDICARLSNVAPVTHEHNHNTSVQKLNSIFSEYRDEIAVGDFSPFDNRELSEDEKMLLKKYKDAYDVLGEDLVLDCVISSGKVAPIIRMFVDYANRMKRHIEMQELANKLPKSRVINKAIGYINAFTLDDKERLLLKKMCDTEDSSIFSLALTNAVDDDTSYLLLKRFLKWCSFDIKAEIEDLFETLYSNDRIRFVVEMRTKGHTLEQIGSSLGVTRERVRQLESKAKKLFSRLQGRIRIISKISAERNGDTVLTPSEIGEYCEENVTELIYLLQSYKSANYTYDSQLDSFVVGDDSISDRIRNYIDSLPEIVKNSQLDKLLTTASEEVDVPAEALTKAFLDTYRITGDVYHRYRLSLATIYERVLEAHYPNGIKAYDEQEILKFRDIVFNEFGDVGLPKNDRALTARISSICMLCGRGIYRLKRSDYLPKELANRICEYIETNENSIFLTNTIFSIFEDDLVAAGIDNKYFLQGVLHELFGDKFVFRRDYIAKDAGITSLYSAVVEFIKESEFPVSKSQIQEAFPGVTDIVISISVADPTILNFFGEYLHVSRLNISNSEKQYLFDTLEKLVSDGSSHHGKELYEIVSCEKPEIFTRNAALFPFSAFSVIEYLFRDTFLFSRPYFAKKGVGIGRTSERLHDLVYSSYEISISEISEFARDNHFQIQSLLDYANSCNDEFLLVNNDLLTRITNTGITEEVAEQVDNIIADAISQTVPIKNLSVWANLPIIRIPWTEWLVYSVITKWGKRTLTATSSNQLRQSIPLVAPVDNYDPTTFKNVDNGDSSGSFVTDDLSDIDSLLEDIMSGDFLDDY